jgi:hypothetical protein
MKGLIALTMICATLLLIYGIVDEIKIRKRNKK